MRVLSIRISIFIAHFYLSQGTIFKGHLRNHAELLIIIGFVSGGTILHTNYNAHSEMVSSFNLLRVKIMNFLFAMTINTVKKIYGNYRNSMGKSYVVCRYHTYRRC